MDLDATREAFLAALENGTCDCTFPEDVISGMQRYTPDFPNPLQSNIDRILEILDREKILDAPTLYLDFDSSEYEEKRLSLEKEMGFPPNNEDVLTMLRFGSSCDSLKRKSLRGAGLEVMPADYFFTQQPLSTGSTVGHYTLLSVQEEGLNYIATFEHYDGTQTVVTVPSESAIEEWVTAKLSGTPKHDASNPLSFSFDRYISAEITQTLPDGTLISKGVDGTWSFKDRDGNIIDPLDPINPTKFCEFIMMKMASTETLPIDLEPGQSYEYRTSPYFEDLVGSNKKVHKGTAGFQAFSFNPVTTRHYSTFTSPPVLDRSMSLTINGKTMILRPDPARPLGFSVSPSHKA